MPKSIEDIITSYGRLEERVNIFGPTSRSLVLCNSYGNIITCWMYVGGSDYAGALPDMLDILKKVIRSTVENIEYSGE